MVYDLVGKAFFCKGYWNPKRKLGVTTHFADILKEKWYKLLCILKLFIIFCLIVTKKYKVTPIFFLDISNSRYKDLLSCIVINSAKIPLY